jgi:superfamily II DNA or RNA helicase
MIRVSETTSNLSLLRKRLQDIDAERAVLLAQIESLEKLEAQYTQPGLLNDVGEATAATVHQHSSEREKIALFRSLFRGREDVFPHRWHNAKTGKSGYSPVCGNEWVKGICEKPRVKCSDCPNQRFIPVSDNIVRNHLRGKNPDDKWGNDFIAGVYPLLPGDACWFLAADFDKDTWKQDAVAFLGTCCEHGVPAALERSRSGNGGHIWIFFSEPVPASSARAFGSWLLTETMERHPALGFESYDRLFPNQNTMPLGGFGNLIALPLQYKSRQQGNSVFVDEQFTPHPDQWAFLSRLERLSLAEVEAHVANAARHDRVLGVRLPMTDEESATPWQMMPSRQPRKLPKDISLPASIKAVLGAQVFVAKENLPAPLVARILRLAAFQNPEFYRAQAMRMPTFDKPRVIACAELFPQHIGLPRGCLEDLQVLLTEQGITLEIEDQRHKGKPLSVKFNGILYPEQKDAVKALGAEDIGILAVPTAFGKTVVAAQMIAKRKCNTLILVHRKQLLEQWRERLQTFLNVETDQIGSIGGGKRKPTGRIDIALLQSLIRKNTVDDIVADYGHIIVDECHHLSAVSFEAVARAAKARYVLGLSATVARKDGHHPIILMQCGPVRYHVDAKDQARARPFAHRLIWRDTAFQIPPDPSRTERLTIQELYAALVQDTSRNDLITQDVLRVLADGRKPLILTERKEHIAILAAKLVDCGVPLFQLHGGLSAKERKAELARLAALPTEVPRLLIATGRYIGEGFDAPELDTLFLALPISWKGTLAQYAGRLHRLHPDKTEVRVYDYRDSHIRMLASMAEKRLSGYRAIGYETGESSLLL